MQEFNAAENYKAVCESMPEGVTLIAVSKTRSIDEIRLIAGLGQKDFGENKAQELCEKFDSIENVRWHFIGHLQTNKVKSVVGKAYLIHSVDSIHLADAIEKQAAKLGIKQNVLVQVNVAGEIQKSGVPLQDAEDLCDYIRTNCKHIDLKGLMQVAPDCENKEDTREYFSTLTKLLSKMKLDILSMGMSEDYKIAIEEGSNMVRIGTAIFGPRDYSKQKG